MTPPTRHDGRARDQGGTRSPTFDAPPELRAWRFDVSGDAFALLEWPVPRGGRFVATKSALTPAESAVTKLASEGLSNAAIAAARRCSPRTVANQLASAFRKLGVRSRVELVAAIASSSE